MALKSSAKRLFATRTGFRLRSRCAGRGGLAVLTYHRINDAQPMFEGLHRDVFEAQMEWLSRNVHVMRASELPRVLAGEGPDELTVMVTFDDGYRDFAERAYPVLKRYGIPAMVFLPTRLIDQGGLIWTDRIAAAMQLTHRRRVVEPWPGGGDVELGSETSRAAAIVRAKRAMKQADDAERRHWEDTLIADLDVADQLASLPREMLTWDVVRSMRDLVDFGSHSHTHPIMSRLTAVDFERELAVSRDRMISELGGHPRWFAYPNGTRSDIPARAGEVLAKLGYEAAFSTIAGINQRGKADRWRLCRQPTGAATIADFAWLIASAGDDP